MKTIQSIVVVGATGMLGSKVSRILKEEGCSVTAVVRNTQKIEEIESPNVDL
ncbi:MAG: NAD-dependent epimerase/dehydratase family protein [Balneolaceae bacterium]|nr:MAG: NAD-dependent epimerase/dehydratase family protein [Balneolaceae bacterium]